MLSNEDFEKMLETSDEWITTRTGMKRRHVAAPEEACSDLAMAAARDALERAHLDAAQIDCWIVGTVTPDFPFPATAAIVATKLGAGPKAAFDIEIACSGFVYGLSVGSSLVRSGVHRRVMVIGAEKLTGVLDYTDRTTAILFGDGAGAAILESSEADSFLGAELGSDAQRPELLWIPAGGSRTPITAELLAAGEDRVHMSGKEIFRVAINKMCECALSALEHAGLTPSDVTYLVPHQANRRIIDLTAKMLGIEQERVIVNIHEYGNTSAASIPIALSEADHQRRFKDGDILLFLAFGGGLSWGAVAWRWTA